MTVTYRVVIRTKSDSERSRQGKPLAFALSFTDYFCPKTPASAYIQREREEAKIELKGSK